MAPSPTAPKRDHETNLPSNCGPSTLAVHAGEHRQKLANSITDPIVCAATYTFANTQAVLDYVEQDLPREEYGRYGNPGERVVEAEAGRARRGRRCRAVRHRHVGDRGSADGQAQRRRRSDLLRRMLPSQPRVLRQAHVAFRRRHAPGQGLRLRGDGSGHQPAHATADQRIAHQSALERRGPGAICGHRNAARRRNADRRDAGDPYNAQPIRHGIDYVLHSATKYLAGHNDLLAGVIVGRQEALEPVRKLRGIMGAINSPHNFYLLQRGSRPSNSACCATIRTDRRWPSSWPLTRGSNACIIPGCPPIRITKWPGAPCAALADLITFLVKDADWRQTADVVDAVKLPRIGPSLGGVESLIEQPLVMSYHEVSPEDRAAVRHLRQHDPSVLRHRRHGRS